MAGPNTLTFTDAGWDTEVLQSDTPVLVDFWATWCGPCRAIAPSVDALADQYAGKVKVGKLDVDSNGATAMRYQVRGIPTLLMIKGGQVVGQLVGGASKSAIQELIDKNA
jgi:thioredoxin 1